MGALSSAEQLSPAMIRNGIATDDARNIRFIRSSAEILDGPVASTTGPRPRHRVCTVSLLTPSTHRAVHARQFTGTLRSRRRRCQLALDYDEMMALSPQN